MPSEQRFFLIQPELPSGEHLKKIVFSHPGWTTLRVTPQNIDYFYSGGATIWGTPQTHYKTDKLIHTQSRDNTFKIKISVRKDQCDELQRDNSSIFYRMRTPRF